MEFNDDCTVVAELKARVREFVTARDWDQFHYPKDLAIGLAIEAAELLEQFRFRSNEEVEGIMADPGQRQRVAHELADVLYFVLLMCANLGLDASSILAEKLELSAQRYPVEEARGRNLKYTELPAAAGQEEEE